MQYAIVKGSVVATQKVKDLQGVALKVIVPCNEKREPVGEPIVAADPISVRPGDLVLWVGKREASMALKGATVVNNFPLDAAITGIIDDIG